MSAQENQVPCPLRAHTILAFAKRSARISASIPMFLRVPFAAIGPVQPNVGDSALTSCSGPSCCCRACSSRSSEAPPQVEC